MTLVNGKDPRLVGIPSQKIDNEPFDLINRIAARHLGDLFNREVIRRDIEERFKDERI